MSTKDITSTTRRCIDCGIVIFVGALFLVIVVGAVVVAGSYSKGIMGCNYREAMEEEEAMNE